MHDDIYTLRIDAVLVSGTDHAAGAAVLIVGTLLDAGAAAVSQAGAARSRSTGARGANLTSATSHPAGAAVLGTFLHVDTHAAAVRQSRPARARSANARLACRAGHAAGAAVVGIGRLIAADV